MTLSDFTNIRDSINCVKVWNSLYIRIDWLIWSECKRIYWSVCHINIIKEWIIMVLINVLNGHSMDSTHLNILIMIFKIERIYKQEFFSCTMQNAYKLLVSFLQHLAGSSLRNIFVVFILFSVQVFTDLIINYLNSYFCRQL